MGNESMGSEQGHLVKLVREEQLAVLGKCGIRMPEGRAQYSYNPEDDFFFVRAIVANPENHSSATKPPVEPNTGNDTSNPGQSSEKVCEYFAVPRTIIIDGEEYPLNDMGHTIHPSARVAGHVALGPGVLVGPNATVAGAVKSEQPTAILHYRSVIGHNAKVIDSTVGPYVSVGAAAEVFYSTLGARTKIGSKARVNDSKVRSETVIGDSSGVFNSTLGSDVVVGKRSRIDKSNIGNVVVIGDFNSLDSVQIGEHVILGDSNNLHNGTRVDDFTKIGDGNHIGRQVELGKGNFIGNMTEIGRNVITRNDVQVLSNALVRPGAYLGHNVIVSTGASVDPNDVVRTDRIVLPPDLKPHKKPFFKGLCRFLSPRR